VFNRGGVGYVRDLVAIVFVLAVAACATPPHAGPDPATEPQPPAVLVFTRTEGYRHASIPEAVAALRTLAAADGLAVDQTEDPARFNPESLAQYRVVVFANTTGPLLDGGQRAAFEQWLRAGGGFIGLHAAADTAYDWPFYGELVGAWFDSHPPGLQRARVRFEAADTEAALGPWSVTDELYDFRRNPRPQVTVIATLHDRGDGGGMGPDHPIAWCHDRLGGRAWYMGLGHDARIYADPVFRTLLRTGLRYALGMQARCDEVSSGRANMAQ